MMGSNIFAILGIIFTVLFGGLSLLLIIRRRYPGQITFVKETSLALFDSLAKNFPELSVNYQTKPVSEGIVFLKGALLNTGAKDIDEIMVKENISINLPDNFKWLSAKVISTSPRLQANTNVSENTINIHTGLFRCKEFIRFEALAEVPITETKKGKKPITLEDKLGNAIRIAHRITDTQKVLIKDLPNPEKGSKRSKSLLFLVILSMIVLISVPLSFHFRGWPVETHYIMKGKKDVNIEVKVLSIRNGKVRIKGVKNKKFRKTMLEDDFLNQQELIPILAPEPGIKFLVPVLVIYVLFPGILWILTYREQREGRKLRKLLSIS